MTSLLVPSRRGFLKAALTLMAAPAIVKVDSLMKVAGVPLEPFITEYWDGDIIKTRVDVLYGSMYVRKEWVITLDQFSERILRPMITAMADNIENVIMQGSISESPFGSLIEAPWDPVPPRERS